MENSSQFSAVEPHPYGIGQGQPQHLVPLQTPTYHSADGTQAFAVDEYGRHWQLPPAPKLTSAAARGWAHFGQDQSALMLPYTAPWTASSAPYQQHPYHHPGPLGRQQHFDIEQQMMLQHQLAKSQHRRSVPQLAPPRLQTGQRAPPSSFHMQPQNSTTNSSGSVMGNNVGRLGYAPQSGLYAPAFRNPNEWSQPLSQVDYRNGQTPVPTVAPPKNNVYDLQQTYSHPGVPVPFQGFAHPHADQSTPAPSEHVPAQMPVYATWQGSSYHTSAPFAERRRSELGQLPGSASVSQGWAWMPQQPQQQFGYTAHDSMQRHTAALRGADPPLQAYNRDHTVVRARSHKRAQWPLQADQQQQQQQQYGQHQEHEQQLSSQGKVPNAEVTSPAEDLGAGPPSPSTLDRSGVSLSNFGAEIIWHACVGLLEPQLVVEAHRDAYIDGRSPTSVSSMSSPMLSTPLTTPQSPSPGAKDLEASARLLSNLGINYGLSSPLDVDEDPAACSRNTWGGGSQSVVTRSSRLYAASHHATSPPRASTSGQSPSSESLQSSHLQQSAAQPLSSPMLLSSLTTSHSPQRSAYASRLSFARDHSASRSDLKRTKSQERSRAAVIAVLSLVSPHWQWTKAAVSLPTLSEQSRKSLDLGRRQEAQHTDSHPARDGASLPLSPANIGTESSPAFRRFAHQVLAQTLLSPTAFLLGLLFALRVSLLAIDSSGNTDPEAIEVLATPPSAAPFKLFTLGLMMANKHLDDNTFLNKTWNEVTGIPLTELNKMEQFYLIRCNYEIAVPDRIWIAFLRRVQRREEAKILAGSFSKEHHHQPLGDREGSEHMMPSPPPLAKDQTSQRIMSALGDMLSAVDATAVPEPSDLLCDPAHEAADNEIDRIAPIQHNTVVVQGQSAYPQPKRPSAALVDHHQQCQSAPPGAIHYVRDEGHQFDALPRNPDQPQRPLYDSLARSLSDFATASSSSSSIITASTASKPSSRPHSQIHEAPLAPSALLELLNRGRNLTSAH